MTFINNWLYIIRNCNYDNTYKAAWSKAITEISLDIDYDSYQTQEAQKENNNKIEISLTQIAERVIRYYWSKA